MKTRQIVAMGGFSSPQGAARLAAYVLSLTGLKRPRVCHLPTAGGDAESDIQAFYATFTRDRCQTSHLALFRRTEKDLRGLLLRQHVIFVGGGNTANLLAVWRVHGVDSIMREAWEAGVVLCGVSAGSLCWFEDGVTDSYSLDLDWLGDGLGLLGGSNCPHYDSEELRRPVYQSGIAAGRPAGFAAEDDVALHFVGDGLGEVVSARSGASAYRVESAGGKVVESRLRARLLR